MNFFTTEISDPRFESQGLRHITVKSPHLKGRGDITVFIPQGQANAKNMPVVTLLHGVYGSHWAWAMKAGVHLSLQRLIDLGQIAPMVLAMPSDGLYDDGSGYLVHHQADFETWITQDVPRALEELIPAVGTQSPHFIAGLSMGGYGALRLGAKYPGFYKGFSGLSSITRFEEIESFYEPEHFKRLEEAVVDRESVVEVMLRNRQRVSPFRFDCGVDDPLMESNIQLHKALTEHHIDHVFQMNPGSHEWAYWEKHIEDTLLFFNQILSLQ